MELYHHGIKGQKWGVRRYQNKDGSLTELGKARYSKPVDANNMPRKQWLKLVDSGRDFVVSKGQEAYRSTTTEYEIEAGKKYVSFRAADIGVYEQFAENNGGAYNVVYSTKNNMRVAGMRTQAELLQEIYGKELRTDDRWKKYVQKGWVKVEEITKPIPKMTDEEFSTYMYYNPYGHDKDILNKPITNKETKNYIDKLAKKGYDAAVDMLDRSIAYSDGPMIILNSKDVLERKSHSRAD